MWFLLVSQSLIASCSVLVRRSRCVRRGTERDRVGRPGTQLLGWSWDRQPVFRYCLRASQDDLRCGHLVRLGTIVEGSPEFGIEAHWHGSGSGGAHWGAAWPPAKFETSSPASASSLIRSRTSGVSSTPDLERRWDYFLSDIIISLG
jgi:hypothetical protein